MMRCDRDEEMGSDFVRNVFHHSATVLFLLAFYGLYHGLWLGALVALGPALVFEFVPRLK